MTNDINKKANPRATRISDEVLLSLLLEDAEIKNDEFSDRVMRLVKTNEAKQRYKSALILIMGIMSASFLCYLLGGFEYLAGITTINYRSEITILELPFEMTLSLVLLIAGTACYGWLLAKN